VLLPSLAAQTMIFSEQLETFLPESDWRTDWKWNGGPTYYSPDILFEYIDGNADLYLAYGFQTLITVEYFGSTNLSLVVDIYDMGTPLNAFGVYSNYRSPQSDFVAIGTEGILSDYFLRFIQGQYIVDLNINETDLRLIDFRWQVAQEIARRIPAPKVLPALLDLLPTLHLIAKTPKYIAEGLLGHAFFPRGLEALYQIAQDTVKAFIVLTDSEKTAAKAFTAFGNYIQKNGQEFQKTTTNGFSTLSGTMPYHQHALASLVKTYICGIFDLSNPQAGVALLQILQQQILNFQAETPDATKN
jgi:hypothetical protein